MRILFLLFPMFLYSQNEVCFEIESNPYPNSSSLGCFSKYIRVLDCFDVYAESTVSDEKVLHVAAVIAELLDNDEDGEVDDLALKNKLNQENALMPVVTGGIGVCHLYVDKTSDLEMAKDIIRNAKVQRPTVCNALDAVLIHSSVANDLLPELAKHLAGDGVELRCDTRSLSLLGEEKFSNVIQSDPSDWGTEFLALTASVKVVDSLEEALEHIEDYGSGHSEAIITDDNNHAMRFLNEVDAACVYVNASTRFTDGSALGLGAEVAISTNKLHARGPMGLRELTSYKWTIMGDGHVRP